jgi:hypothetical protein
MKRKNFLRFAFVRGQEMLLKVTCGQQAEKLFQEAFYLAVEIFTGDTNTP